MKKLSVILVVLSVMVGSVSTVFSAADPAIDVRPVVRPMFEKGLAEGKSVGDMIGQALATGPNLTGLLVVAKEMGLDAKTVLAELLVSGIAPEVVAAAALEAGYPQDLVAAAVGFEPAPGLGYTTAPGSQNGTPVAGPPASLGGGGRGTTPVSPSTL